LILYFGLQRVHPFSMYMEHPQSGQCATLETIGAGRSNPVEFEGFSITGLIAPTIAGFDAADVSMLICLRPL
jgi:hypothetical protein